LTKVTVAGSAFAGSAAETDRVRPRRNKAGKSRAFMADSRGVSCLARKTAMDSGALAGVKKD
jgi:hypothetical protein